MVITRQSLVPYHTFGLQVEAAFFVDLVREEQIDAILSLPYRPRLILGGGSNVLFTKNFEGLIIHNSIGGISIIEEKDHYAIIEVGGGVIWHDLVLWSIKHKLGGLENLSLIPGTVGAAPIQNIGAYGVEFDSIFVSLKAVEISSGKSQVFRKEDCGFGYRTSVFKTLLKNQYLITQVRLRLSRNHHKLSLEYGELKETLSQRGITQPTIQDISDCVILIRTRKLPDPTRIGNAGSFFKNPVVNKTKYLTMLNNYPDMPSLHSRGWKKDSRSLVDRTGWLEGIPQGRRRSLSQSCFGVGQPW